VLIESNRDAFAKRSRVSTTKDGASRRRVRRSDAHICTFPHAGGRFRTWTKADGSRT
jgi:hypothetical protein